VKSFDKYLQRHGAVRPLQGGPLPDQSFSAVVVIPALGESETLPGTLDSLAACQPELLARTLVVVVVNSPPVDQAPDFLRAHVERLSLDNCTVLAQLQVRACSRDMVVRWIDATTPGHELPAGTGVGMARKIGADTALHQLRREQTGGARQDCADPVLFHLDADTMVEPDYLRAAAVLRETGQPGGVVAFKHRRSDDPEVAAATIAFELYLHYYVTAFRWAGSPYAFHTIGSTMLCTADGYVRAGGMPAKRQAGEDFYFLQQLAKTGGVCRIGETEVHPSSRLSVRVPFGTGQSLRRCLDHPTTGALPVCDFRVFTVLADLYRSVRSGLRRPAADILADLRPAAVGDFLRTQRFGTVWPRFQAQHRQDTALWRAFNCWFDALMCIRLVHHLTDRLWPEIDLFDGWRGLASGTDIGIPNIRALPLLCWCRATEWGRE